MVSGQTDSPTGGDSRRRHLQTFGLKALALIPIALLGWLLGMNGPVGAAAPLIILVGGVVILAVDGVLSYRTEKRASRR